MDSIMCHLRVDFSGRGELAERQQKLGILMSRLRKVGWLVLLAAAMPRAACSWLQHASQPCPAQLQPCSTRQLAALGIADTCKVAC